jgi:hypothetical protein
MASTRNKNTRNDYILEKRMNERMLSYNQFQHSAYGQAYNANFMCLGGNPRLPRDVVSHNPVETESYLFGINSTNLEVNKLPFVSQPKNVCFKSFFTRQATIVPEPLVIDKNQRPNFMS